MIELGILVALLVLGYGVGSYREKRHYQSIFEREAQFANIMVFDSRSPIHIEQHQGGQLVMGHVVISVDYFKAFVAGLRLLVGGRLTTYESLLDRGRREAVLRMKQEAEALNADHIFNVKFETASISKGAQNSIGSVEVFVYGSALRFAQ